MSTLLIKCEDCNEEWRIPTTLRSDQSMLHNATLVDTLVSLLPKCQCPEEPK